MTLRADTGRPLDLENLDQAYVAIVQLATQPMHVIHQVTLRPDKVHDGFIRLGETQGDECNGWQYPGNVCVLSVLGTAHEENGKWECKPLAEGDIDLVRELATA